jgi:hypothetical protein
VCVCVCVCVCVRAGSKMPPTFFSSYNFEGVRVQHADEKSPENPLPDRVYGVFLFFPIFCTLFSLMCVYFVDFFSSADCFYDQ